MTRHAMKERSEGDMKSNNTRQEKEGPNELDEVFVIFSRVFFLHSLQS